MKPVQRFALIFGALYVGMGIMGFIPALVSDPTGVPTDLGQVDVVSGYGRLMGLFPINTAHNLIHIVVGGLGIAASIAPDSSRLYSGQLGIWFSVLAILGLIPVANTLFGLAPLYSNDVWLHALTAGLGIYFGFISQPDLRTQFDRELREKAAQDAASQQS